MNDDNDEFHEAERKRLNLSWDDYWYRLAKERVGSDEEQVADVLAQLRAGGYANRVRADTIERLVTARQALMRAVDKRVMDWLALPDTAENTTRASEARLIYNLIRDFPGEEKT